MKFNINGKLLKDIVRIVSLKGKYNSGFGNKVEEMPNQIFIRATEDMVYFYNGNPGTFVVYRYETEAEPGVCCVQTNVLLKYIASEDTTFSCKDGKVKMLVGDSIITFPTVFRSEHLNIVTKLQDYLSDLTASEVIKREKVRVTPMLELCSKFMVSKNQLISAMDMAERVGNSVYKLDWDTESLEVSSKTNTSEVSTEITTSRGSGMPSTVDISLPVGAILKHVDDVRVALCYDDDRPLIIATEEVTILRAPREVR